jgi:hypothetical protein
LRVMLDAEDNRNYVINGEASWLACHDVCVPGKAPIELEIKVEEAGATEDIADASGERELKTARASLPQGGFHPPTGTWEDGSWVYHRAGATRLLFFPDTASAPIVDLLHTGDVAGQEIRLTPQKPSNSRQISGILGIQTPADTLYFSIRETLPQEP